MVRSELVKRMAARNPHLHRRDIEQVVDAILGEITDAMVRGERVELRGFGVFSTKLRPAHTGLNPLTGDKVPVAEKYTPLFKIGKEMRERLNCEPRPLEARAEGVSKSTMRDSSPPTSYPSDIPGVWRAHIRRLEATLKHIESELRVATGAGAIAVRARAETIRNKLARFR